ncbi:Toxin HigB / Protein kinase domain of HipA, partial [hydrothermal vent metagenome]
MVVNKTRRSSKSHALNIWMNGVHVGVWKISSQRISTFQYSADWLLNSKARSLSLSLPILASNREHSGHSVDYYFDNLLPDNAKIRDRLQQKYATNTTQAYDLLAEIGRDCVGAIQLLPIGEKPDNWQSIKSEPLSEIDIESILKNVVSSSLLVNGHDDFRISIAGAQEKTALLWHNNQWHKPHGSTPTTHILKLPLGIVGNMQANMSHSIDNEWLCSKILSEYGLNTAYCKMQTFGDTKALIVERFDRKKNDSGKYWLRLPQEDMCQALGLPSGSKYQSDGGPGMEDILDLLRGSKNNTKDRRDFFKTQILFWMLAATDGHAKNFSIHNLPNDQFTMTPLYDVLSTWPIIGRGANQLNWHEAKLAMAFKGKNTHYACSNIMRRHINAMAFKCGIGKNAEDIIIDIIENTDRVIDAVNRILPPDMNQNVFKSITT